MRIVVPVKRVARLDDEIELRPDGRAVDPNAVDWELNEWDAFSLEAAVQIREAREEGEVVVVTVDHEDADETLRDCLARGADRAVRVFDEALRDADPVAVALALAAVVARESPQLVLCGVQSADAAHGATGMALAGHLGWPRAAVVRRLELDAAGDTVLVERELDGGFGERLRVPLPAVLTIQTGLNEPRYATLRAIKQASARPLEELGLADLGLDEARIATATGSVVTSLRRPDAAGQAELLEGDTATVAARIAAIVREKLSR